MKIIAHIKTDFPTKFGLPRQSGLVDSIKGKIVFENPYRDVAAFRGLEKFSHVWILWKFSEAERDDWSPTVRPPLLGGNKRMGVFATRSPYRPNPIGLSAVKLDKIEYDENLGPVLYVSGCDLMDRTQIYDIKPDLPYADSIADATGGFTDSLAQRKLEVVLPDDISTIFNREKITELIGILSGDPRPSYIDDETRIYGFRFCDKEIKFMVNGGELTVTEIK